MHKDNTGGDAAWLPPGQTPTKKFPTVGESNPTEEALDLTRWRLVVEGLIERRLVFTYDEVRQFSQQDRLVDVHCVTGWSQRAMRFTGFPLALLLQQADVKPEARFVRFEAYSPRKHNTSLPLALALTDTWLVHSVNGAQLTVNHGFPLPPTFTRASSGCTSLSSWPMTNPATGRRAATATPATRGLPTTATSPGRLTRGGLLS